MWSSLPTQEGTGAVGETEAHSNSTTLCCHKDGKPCPCPLQLRRHHPQGTTNPRSPLLSLAAGRRGALFGGHSCDHRPISVSVCVHICVCICVLLCTNMCGHTYSCMSCVACMQVHAYMDTCMYECVMLCILCIFHMPVCGESGSMDLGDLMSPFPLSLWNPCRHRPLPHCLKQGCSVITLLWSSAGVLTK